MKWLVCLSTEAGLYPMGHGIAWVLWGEHDLQKSMFEKDDLGEMDRRENKGGSHSWNVVLEDFFHVHAF